MAGALGSDEAITGINVTPLVDIVLVLLIILMATSHIIAHRALNLNLPKILHTEAAPTQSVHIVMLADKSLRLGNTRMNESELAVNLGQMARLDPNLRVTVGADRGVSWGDVAGLLDILKGAGVSKVATEVEPK